MGVLSNDPASLTQQYGTTDRLRTRTAVWRDTADGRNPRRAALAAVVRAKPTSFVEIGCGTGEFAREVQDALPAARVIATDASEAMVLATADKGVVAQVSRADDLPFDDDTFDAAYAGWMLYHVPDVEAAVAEIRRVVRPGGVFVAATNGDDHLADLLTAAGGDRLVTGFSSQNGAAALQRHFADVTREDFASRAQFDDHASAVAYLATYREDLAAGLPEFEGPRGYAGEATVFIAR
ncbi:class I SAM-dependent methyltransferase [Calidifontibacter terrae]